jgi:6-phosphogluconate dehydrogenase
MLDRVLEGADHDDDDFLSNAEIGRELGQAFPALKNVVLKSIEADAYVPSLSATLEYYKYSSSTDLPTQFMEAQLDFFGAHMFDLKSEDPGKPTTGRHHYEWKPARGILDDDRGTDSKL